MGFFMRGLGRMRRVLTPPLTRGESGEADGGIFKRKIKINPPVSFADSPLIKGADKGNNNNHAH
jgi:hypothetical protein